MVADCVGLGWVELFVHTTRKLFFERDCKKFPLSAST